MPIDPTAAQRVYSPPSYEVSGEKVREFAQAVGVADSADQLEAPPTFAIIPVMRGFETMLNDLGVEFAQVVHVDQSFRHTRPVRAGDRLHTKATIESIRHVAGNDLLAVSSEISDDSGTEVCRAQSTMLIRALGPVEDGADV